MLAKREARLQRRIEACQRKAKWAKIFRDRACAAEATAEVAEAERKRLERKDRHMIRRMARVTAEKEAALRRAQMENRKEPPSLGSAPPGLGSTHNTSKGSDGNTDASKEEENIPLTWGFQVPISDDLPELVSVQNRRPPRLRNKGAHHHGPRRWTDSTQH